MKDEEEKKIEIVSGDGKDLEISPVFEHLSIAKPKIKDDKDKKKGIVIPKGKTVTTNVDDSNVNVENTDNDKE